MQSEPTLGYLPLPILRKLRNQAEPPLLPVLSPLSSHAQDIIYMLTSERSRSKLTFQRPPKAQYPFVHVWHRTKALPKTRLERRDFRGMHTADAVLENTLSGRNWRRRQSADLRELKLKVSKL